MSAIDLPQIIRLFAALFFVLALMGGLALALRRLGLAGGAAVKSTEKRRLKILETLPLDSRHRAVLLGRDEAQHLVILGPEGGTVVESGIKGVRDAGE